MRRRHRQDHEEQDRVAARRMAGELQQRREAQHEGAAPPRTARRSASSSSGSGRQVPRQQQVRCRPERTGCRSPRQESASTSAQNIAISSDSTTTLPRPVSVISSSAPWRRSRSRGRTIATPSRLFDAGVDGEEFAAVARADQRGGGVRQGQHRDRQDEQDRRCLASEKQKMKRDREREVGTRRRICARRRAAPSRCRLWRSAAAAAPASRRSRAAGQHEDRPAVGEDQRQGQRVAADGDMDAACAAARPTRRWRVPGPAHRRHHGEQQRDRRRRSGRAASTTPKLMHLLDHEVGIEEGLVGRLAARLGVGHAGARASHGAAARGAAPSCSSRRGARRDWRRRGCRRRPPRRRPSPMYSKMSERLKPSAFSPVGDEGLERAVADVEPVEPRRGSCRNAPRARRAASASPCVPVRIQCR